MILVTGATGTVGREVVRLLAEAGAPTRALTRDPGKAKVPTGVEVVKGDFSDAASLTAAMQGVDKLFLLAVGPRLPEYEAGAITAAKAAGVKHVVKISTYGVENAPDIAITQWHLKAETALRASGLGWTFLRPSGFMSNALGWAGSVKGQGAVYGILGEVKGPPIHPTDIAACAAKVLLGEGHAGKSYLLTGGELLSVGDQCRILGEAIGKPVRYVNVTEEKLRESLLAAGRPPPIAEAVIGLQRAIRDSGGSPMSDDVATLLGRPPLTWAQWCQANAAAFKAS